MVVLLHWRGQVNHWGPCKGGGGGGGGGGGSGGGVNEHCEME